MDLHRGGGRWIYIGAVGRWAVGRWAVDLQSAIINTNEIGTVRRYEIMSTVFDVLSISRLQIKISM